MITKEDVHNVANHLKMNVSDEQVAYVLENYSEEDDTSLWNEIIENLLYQVI